MLFVFQTVPKPNPNPNPNHELELLKNRCFFFLKSTVALCSNIFTCGSSRSRS